MQTFHLPKEKGYYLQLKLMGHWAAHPGRYLHEKREDETLMYLQLLNPRYVSACTALWECLGHLSSGWAETQEGNFMLLSSTLSFSFWDNFSSPLFSWSLEKYVKDSKSEAISLAWGRQGDAGKERGWVAGSWLGLLQGTSAGQQQHWSRTSLTLLSPPEMFSGCSLLCCAPLGWLINSECKSSSQGVSRNSIYFLVENIDLL